MAILNFPDNPANGQLYPVPCPEGTTQYRWEQSTGIWRIVGVATGVNPGTYGDQTTVAQVTVDVQGIVTGIDNVPIRLASPGVAGIVPLNPTTSSVSLTEALTASAGKFLQDQIGNLSACIVPRKNNVVDALNFLQLQINRIDTESTAWCGYYNAQDGYISYVTQAGYELGYRIGSGLPTPSLVNSGDFFIVNVSGNPYLGGDFNAPNEFIPVGNWVYQDRTRWVDVNTGAKTTAKDITFDNRASCFTATNVQAALQQVCSYFRSPIGGATISQQKPENPYQGQLWWDSNDGYFYIYYRDGQGAQWVELGGGGSEALSAGGGTVYEVRTGVGLIGGPITTEGTISIAPASFNRLGGVSVPSASGLTLVGSGALTLTPASSTSIGGVIVGDGLAVDSNGVLSLQGGGSTTASNVTISPIGGIPITVTNVQSALEVIQTEAQNRIQAVTVTNSGITASVSSPDPASQSGTTLTITPVQASTTQVGVVALTSALNGTSETVALTQAAGNNLQGQIQALTGSNVLAGTYSAATGKLLYVTPAAAAKGFVVGQNCPAPSTAIDNFYVIVTVGGNFTPPGATGTSQSGDWFICQAEAGTTPVWFLIDYENAAVTASSVTLTPIPGLRASNVQAGLAEIVADSAAYTQTISSSFGLSVTYGANQNCVINLNAATSTSIGGVYVTPNRGLFLGGDGLLQLSPPTSTTIGGVKAGANITIDPDGTINGTAGGASTASQVSITAIPGIDQATNVQRALELIEGQAQNRVQSVQTTTAGVSASVSAPAQTVNGTVLTINVNPATTSGPGLVQLTNDITGTSETLAPTQKSISILNGKVDALTGANVLAGTYDSSAGTVVTVTPAGRAAGFEIGKQAPLSKNVPDNYYLIVTTGGGFGPVGAVIPQTGIQPGDWFVNENQPSLAPPSWVTIDFVNTGTAAANVSLAPIPGFAPSNVQTGIQQLFTTSKGAFYGISTPANSGLTVTLGTVDVGQGASLVLNPATAGVIGGVKVGANIGVAADGTISVGSNSVGNRFISSSAPTGGNDGDIWYVI